MVKIRFMYEIDGLKTRTDLQLDSCGFCFKLDREIAKLAYQKELPDDSRFQEIGKSIVESCGLTPQRMPYSFVENEKGNSTLLLHYVHVPGTACQLGIDDRYEIEKLKSNDESSRNWIEYSTHNVDSIRQAFALEVLVIDWANRASSILDKWLIRE